LKIDKTDFSTKLEVLSNGLATIENTVAQCSFFVFHGGFVYSHNDDLFCRAPFGDESIQGAVDGKTLIKTINKFKSPELGVRQVNGKIVFRGKNEEMGINTSEIDMPIDDLKFPTEWKKVEPTFSEVCLTAMTCASKDRNQDTDGANYCVHFTPNYIESNDGYQVFRHEFDTGLSEALVDAGSLKFLKKVPIKHVGESVSRLYFKTENDIIISPDKEMEVYAETDAVFGKTGEKLKLPEILTDAAKTASIFAEKNLTEVPEIITVRTSGGVLRLKGEGVTGYYFKDHRIDYQGKLVFSISSPALQRIVNMAAGEFQVCEEDGEMICVVSRGDDWEFVSALSVPEENGN